MFSLDHLPCYLPLEQRTGQVIEAVACETVDLLPFSEYAASLNRKRAAAGVLLRDEQSRILLVETTYKPEWEIPGGAVEAEEAPWTTAARELQEELGIIRRLGTLLVIDHIRTQGVMPEGLAFVFDGGLITQDEVRRIRSTDPEIRTVGLYTLDEAEQLVKPTLHARINTALRAADTGGTVFCEAGRPVATNRN